MDSLRIIPETNNSLNLEVLKGKNVGLVLNFIAGANGCLHVRASCDFTLEKTSNGFRLYYKEDDDGPEKPE